MLQVFYSTNSVDNGPFEQRDNGSTGEMAQQLRAVTAPPEEDLIPLTYMELKTVLNSSHT